MKNEGEKTKKKRFKRNPNMWRLDNEKMDGAFLTRQQFKFTYFYICKKLNMYI